MEFIVLQCWSCERQFYTASERSSHHLEAHERRTRRDGQVLVASAVEAQVGRANGVASHPETKEHPDGLAG